MKFVAAFAPLFWSRLILVKFVEKRVKLRAIWRFTFTVVILFQIKLAKKIVVSVEKELVWRKFITKKTWKVFLLWDQNLGNVRIDANVIIFVFMYVSVKVLKIF